MASLGVFTQLDSIGPEDISIDPALAKDFNPLLVANVDRGEPFTDFVKNNKVWIIVAIVVLIALFYFLKMK